MSAVLMFQIVFNELSAAEMSALPKELQLDLLAEFEVMPEDLAEGVDAERFGALERDGKKLLPLPGPRLPHLFREDGRWHYGASRAPQEYHPRLPLSRQAADAGGR